eukprot:Rmarinus@m.2627
MTVREGDTVWVPDSQHGFTHANVVKVSSDGIVARDESGKEHNVSADKIHVTNPSNQDGVPDNTMLMHLNEPCVLHNIRCRFQRDQIYTATAHILIALNPYKSLPIYDFRTMLSYRGKLFGAMPPHVFAVADKAFRSLLAEKCSQSTLVSGESGAGKTETSKFIMRYILNVSGADAMGDLENKILGTNPILEAFGNAKTIRNNNSSRFGKFVKLHFDSNHRVYGGSIVTYLLEKSRLAFQSGNERNYHIFYELVKGASQEEKDKWGLDSLEKFHYLNQSGCTEIANVSDADKFKEVVTALQTIGYSEKDRADLFRTLAGILYLGNVEFADGTSDDSVVTTPDVTEKAAELLLVQKSKLESAITTRTVTSGRRSTYSVPLKPSEAANARDGLSKVLYARLFEEVVTRINQTLQGEDMATHAPTFIGILDIYGFEFFDKNSFEQLCINYANEKLQQFFVQNVLKAEQDLYKKEGIAFAEIKFKDNQECLDLLEKKQTGLFAILDETCQLAKATDLTYAEKVHEVHTKHAFLLRPKVSRTSKVSHREAFIVKHFAADVTYLVEGFKEKNGDRLEDDVEILICTSECELVKSLGRMPARGSKAAGGGRRAAKKLRTVGSQFLTQLTGLMTDLRSTSPHYIRCIKSTPRQQPGDFDEVTISSQLRESGMMDVIELMHKGFPTRCDYAEIYTRFKDLVPPPIQELDEKRFCEAIVMALGVKQSEFQLGISRIFFRSGKLSFLEELMMHADPAEVAARVGTWMVMKRWNVLKGFVQAGIRAVRLLKAIKARHRFANAAWIMVIYLRTFKAALLDVRETMSRRKAALSGWYFSAGVILVYLRSLRSSLERARGRIQARAAEEERKRKEEEERKKKEEEERQRRLAELSAAEAAKAEEERLKLEEEARIAAEAEEKRRLAEEAEKRRVAEEEEEEAKRRAEEEEGKARAAAAEKEREEAEKARREEETAAATAAAAAAAVSTASIAEETVAAASVQPPAPPPRAAELTEEPRATSPPPPALPPRMSVVSSSESAPPPPLPVRTASQEGAAVVPPPMPPRQSVVAAEAAAPTPAAAVDPEDDGPRLARPPLSSRPSVLMMREHAAQKKSGGITDGIEVLDYQEDFPLEDNSDQFASIEAFAQGPLRREGRLVKGAKEYYVMTGAVLAAFDSRSAFEKYVLKYKHVPEFSPDNVEITEFRKKREHKAEEHYEYVMSVDWGGLNWSVSKRYSAFEDLHKRLPDSLKKKAKLPGKSLHKGEKLARHRLGELQKFMGKVVGDEGAIAALCCFLEHPMLNDLSDVDLKHAPKGYIDLLYSYDLLIEGHHKFTIVTAFEHFTFFVEHEHDLAQWAGAFVDVLKFQFRYKRLFPRNHVHVHFPEGDVITLRLPADTENLTVGEFSNFLLNTRYPGLPQDDYGLAEMWGGGPLDGDFIVANGCFVNERPLLREMTLEEMFAGWERRARIIGANRQVARYTHSLYFRKVFYQASEGDNNSVDDMSWDSAQEFEFQQGVHDFLRSYLPSGDKSASLGAMLFQYRRSSNQETFNLTPAQTADLVRNDIEKYVPMGSLIKVDGERLGPDVIESLASGVAAAWSGQISTLVAEVVRKRFLANLRSLPLYGATFASVEPIRSGYGIPVQVVHLAVNADGLFFIKKKKGVTPNYRDALVVYDHRELDCWTVTDTGFMIFTNNFCGSFQIPATGSFRGKLEFKSADGRLVCYLLNVYSKQPDA